MPRLIKIVAGRKCVIQRLIYNGKENSIINVIAIMMSQNRLLAREITLFSDIIKMALLTQRIDFFENIKKNFLSNRLSTMINRHYRKLYFLIV